MKLKVVQVNPNSVFVDVTDCDICKGDHENIKARPIRIELAGKVVSTSAKLTHTFKCTEKLNQVECKPSQEQMEKVEEQQAKAAKKAKKKKKKKDDN